MLTAGNVVVDKATAPTAQVSCHGCCLTGRSGFAFHRSHNSKVLRGRSQSGRVRVAGLLVVGS